MPLFNYTFDKNDRAFAIISQRGRNENLAQPNTYIGIAWSIIFHAINT